MKTLEDKNTDNMSMVDMDTMNSKQNKWVEFLNVMNDTLPEIHSKVVQAKVDLVDAQNAEGTGYNFLTEKNRIVNRYEGKEEMLIEMINCYKTLMMD